MQKEAEEENEVIATMIVGSGRYLAVCELRARSGWSDPFGLVCGFRVKLHYSRTTTRVTFHSMLQQLSHRKTPVRQNLIHSNLSPCEMALVLPRSSRVDVRRSIDLINLLDCAQISTVRVCQSYIFNRRESAKMPSL